METADLLSIASHRVFFSRLFLSVSALHLLMSQIASNARAIEPVAQHRAPFRCRIQSPLSAVDRGTGGITRARIHTPVRDAA